jgi:protein-tyrosine-phosphatase
MCASSLGAAIATVPLRYPSGVKTTSAATQAIRKRSPAPRAIQILRERLLRERTLRAC